MRTYILSVVSFLSVNAAFAGQFDFTDVSCLKAIKTVAVCEQDNSGSLGSARMFCKITYKVKLTNDDVVNREIIQSSDSVNTSGRVMVSLVAATGILAPKMIEETKQLNDSQQEQLNRSLARIKELPKCDGYVDTTSVTPDHNAD